MQKCRSITPWLIALVVVPAIRGAAMQRYVPVDGGFEITNGIAAASRPLYGGHALDNGRKPVKSVMYAGDDAAVMLSRYHKHKPCDGWLRFKATGDLVARYVWGHEEYEWICFDAEAQRRGVAKVTLVRNVDGDDLLARIAGDVSWTLDGEWSEKERDGEYVRFGRKQSPSETSSAHSAPSRLCVKEKFQRSLAEMRRVATIVKVTTPDALVNAAIAAQCVAADALWEDPCICHGAIGWHNGQGGWRGPYSVVTLRRMTN